MHTLTKLRIVIIFYILVVIKKMINWPMQQIYLDIVYPYYHGLKY